MARARNIKPGFFSNDQLVELPFETRLLFIGLWTIADRAGRLLDRPKKIKIDVFPGDNVDCDAALDALAAAGFIRRYEADGVKAIHITNWDRHQNPHVKEAISTIPAPEDRRMPDRAPDEHHTSPVQAAWEDGSSPEPASFLPERAGLIPDSLNLIPSSLIPDSPFLIPSPSPLPATPATEPKKSAKKEKVTDPGFQEACQKTWRAYASAYFDRYGTAPVRNAKVNKSVVGFVSRLGYDESPLVAAFFLTHQESFYVKKCHDFGLALHDAEKLRTEWATRRMVTNTSAQQADRTGNMMSIVDEIMAERSAA